MPFPDSHLHDNEELVLNLKPHWWTFVQPVAFAVGALVIAILLGLTDITALIWIGWLGVLAALVNLGVVFGKWNTTFFVLTDSRLIFRTGVLSKRGIEIPVHRINNVNFNQSLFERMIGAGDLLVESAGESGQSRFSNVRKPDAVQNEIYRQVEGQRNPPPPHAAPAAHAAPPSGTESAPGGSPGALTAQLEELNDLLNRGLITQEEFAAKRRQLLDRM